MKKWILVIFAVILTASFFYYHNHFSGSASQLIGISPTPTPVPVGVPVVFTIPKFHISAHIESVAMDSKGRMDIPKDFNNVAWYNLGFRPGQKGSAVIDGHVDTPTGAPAVFAYIAQLSPGDIITVQDAGGKSYEFRVSKVTNYPYDQLPLHTIFDSTDMSRLNLITCAGTWDRIHKNYSERTVVFAEKK